MNDTTTPSTTVTLVVTATPNPSEVESTQAYLKGVMPLLKKSGGTFVKRLQIDEAIHGKKSGMILVMEYESKKMVADLFDSEEYQDLIPARDKGFVEMNILIGSNM